MIANTEWDTAEASYDRFLEKHPDIQRVAVALQGSRIKVPTELTGYLPADHRDAKQYLQECLLKGGLINE